MEKEELERGVLGAFADVGTGQEAENLWFSLVEGVC